MAAVYDFSVPFILTSPFGTLPINQDVTLVPSGDVCKFLLVHKSCDSGADLRVSRDDVPQGSGEIQHLHYKQGYEMRLLMQFWQDRDTPACGELLVLMADLLQKHLNALIDDDPIRPLAIVADPLGLTRIQWTPAGASVDRMLDKVRLLERAAFGIAEDNDAITQAAFALLTELPYALDAPQTETDFASSTTVSNGGTSPYYPVSRIYGPFNTFSFANNSILDANGQPLRIVYDAIDNPGSNSVGSGHYLEIDHWANTAYLDGNVANYKAGLTIPQSDFWQLRPGANALSIGGGYTGDGVVLLWQNAYA